MKKALQSLGLFLVVLFGMGFSCSAQNGPSVTSVSLSWTQAVAPSGETISGNCVYRGNTVAGVYILPALYCSASPITSYTDTTATPGTWHYAVTAVASSIESQYSADAIAVVPTAITPPATIVIIVK
jgi:hypothetical protein